MYAVVRIRGAKNARFDIEETFNLLRLRRKNHCILAKDTLPMKGMIRKVKDYVSYGEIDDDALRLLVSKRGRKEGGKKLTKEEAEKAVSELKSAGKATIIKPVFRLTPPSGGFRKSIKQHYPNGEVGYRGKEINKLLEKMV